MEEWLMKNTSSRPWVGFRPIQPGFEAIEPLAPEGAMGAHPVDQGRQDLWLSAVVGLASLALAAYRSGQFQNAQVLGDGRPGDSGPAGQGVHGLLPIAGWLI
jgi:hypothetical protein